MVKKEKMLVLGSAGQIGTDLVSTLRDQFGGDNIIASDVKDQHGYLKESGPFHVLDVLDKQSVFDIIRKYDVKQVFLLAGDREQVI